MPRRGIAAIAAAVIGAVSGARADIAILTEIDKAPAPRIVWEAAAPLPPGLGQNAPKLVLGPGGKLLFGYHVLADEPGETRIGRGETTILTFDADGSPAGRAAFPFAIIEGLAIAAHPDGSVTVAGHGANTRNRHMDRVEVLHRDASGQQIYTASRIMGARAGHEGAIVLGALPMPGGGTLVHGYMMNMASFGPAFALTIGAQGKFQGQAAIGRWGRGEQDRGHQAQFWAVRAAADGFSAFVELAGAPRYAIQRYDRRGVLAANRPVRLEADFDVACAAALPGGAWAAASRREKEARVVTFDADGRRASRIHYIGDFDPLACAPAADAGLVLWSTLRMVRIGAKGEVLWTARAPGALDRFGAIYGAEGLERGAVVVAGRARYDAPPEERSRFLFVRFAPPQ